MAMSYELLAACFFESDLARWICPFWREACCMPECTFENIYEQLKVKLSEIFGPDLPYLDEIAYALAKLLAHNLGVARISPEEYAGYLKQLRRLIIKSLAEWAPLQEAAKRALEEVAPNVIPDAKRFYELLLKKIGYEMGWLELAPEELEALLSELAEALGRVYEETTGTRATSYRPDVKAVRVSATINAVFVKHRIIPVQTEHSNVAVRRYVEVPGCTEIRIVGG